MGYIYRLGHNGTTRSGIYLPGNIPLSNGGNTGSISGEGTRYLHCASGVPSNNLVIGNDTLHCQGKKMSGNISIESVTAPYLNWVNVGGWSNGACCIYWSAGAHDAVIVRRNGTPIYYGGGNSYELSSGNWVTGYVDSGLSIGSTYYYTVQPYRTYFGSTWYGYESSSVGYYAANYSGSDSFTYSRNIAVPTGVRSIYVQAVGAGGTGGNSAFLEWSDPSVRASSGGGGGGGYIARQSISVIPGQTISVGVGSGATTATANGVTVTASKGGDGGHAYCYASDTIGGNGGNGGSGGGGGNAVTSSGNYGRKTAGGSNGGNGTTGAGGWSGKTAGVGGTGSGANCYINGTLFATGGMGGFANANPYYEESYDGGANTGNGGDGAYSCWRTTTSGKSGGTGFCLISW